MRYSEIVKEKNPIIYTIVKNALDNKKVPHAYLFTAQLGQVVEEEYLFIIQELISKDTLRDPLSYSDLIVLDGTQGIIKKEFVINAVAQLQQTALDAAGIKILVIRNIENSNKQSLNSLLKFIEEPTPNTYILMTTNNLGSVLPTIKSRAQVVTVKPVNLKKFANELVIEGISEEHSYLYANVFNSKKDALANNNDDFKHVYERIIDTLENALANHNVLVTELGPQINKSNFHITLSLLNEFISDIWREEQLLPLSFGWQKDLIQKYSLVKFNFAEALKAINEFIVLRNFHVNFDLHKNKLLIKLGECYE